MAGPEEKEKTAEGRPAKKKRMKEQRAQGISEHEDVILGEDNKSVIAAET